MLNLKQLLVVIFCPFLLNGQNIILNGDFEDTIPAFFGSLKAKGWETPSKGSPDYFTKFHENNHPTISSPTNFAGFQYPKTGLAYQGIIIYTLTLNNDSKRYREYLQTKFERVLKQDSTYCLQLYISLADSFQYASKNKLGVYFSNNQIGSNDFFYLPYTPQIMVSPDTFISEKKEWVEYNFKYQATGGEQYITIGNFTDSTEVDTLFVEGGSKDLGYKGTYYYIDDVYLGHCDSVPLDTNVGLREAILEQQISVYPNPTKEQLFIKYDGNERLQIQLYNLVGQSVVTLSGVEMRQQQNGKQLQLSVGHLPKGIYLLKIIAGKERISRKIIKE